MYTIQTASFDPPWNEGCACCGNAQAERVERGLRMLDKLAELGTALAEAIALQALAYADGQPAKLPLLGGDNPSLAFDRVNRSVRQTLALQARLAEDEETRAKRRAAEAAAKEAKAAAAAEREKRRRRKVVVRRVVEKVIDVEAGDRRHAEGLLTRLYERLEDPDDTDFGDRPIALIVAGICKDLRLVVDSGHWAEEIKAIEKAFAGEEAGAPGPTLAARTETAGETAPAEQAPSGCDPPPSADVPMAENDLPKPVPPQRE